MTPPSLSHHANRCSPWLGLVSLLISSFGSPAQQPSRPLPGQPNDLRTAEEQQTAALAPIFARRDERFRNATAAYVATLDQIERDATSRGDLDTVLSAKGEREAVSKPGVAQPAKGLPKALIPHRQRFDRAISEAQAASNREEAAQIKVYLPILDALQARLTKQGKVEAAVEVKQRRGVISTQLSAVESGKGTAALPAFEAPRAPEPMRLTSAAPASGASITPIVVASVLETKGKISDPAADTIVFNAPSGDGRNGAKGILLKDEAAGVAATRAGSTWAFRYTRGGTARGVQIIHPIGRGQAIVHLDRRVLAFQCRMRGVSRGMAEATQSGSIRRRILRRFFRFRMGLSTRLSRA
jgi:hypothetical protein